MLDGYGLHTMIWDSADERLGEFLVASPADASRRGLELHVRQGGAAADLTGAEVYFIWRHKMAGTRGCEPMDEIDATLGQYVVYYPAAMQEAEGVVEAQFMVTNDGKSISTRAFTIRVEPVTSAGPRARTASRYSWRRSCAMKARSRSRPLPLTLRTRLPRPRATRRILQPPSQTRSRRQPSAATTTGPTVRTASL